MQKIHHLLLVGTLVLTTQILFGQSSPNCTTASDDDSTVGEVFFNYGSAANTFNIQSRSDFTIGQPVVGTTFGQNTVGAFGFWSRRLAPPLPPVIVASEGDFEDHVALSWSPDPLSPEASEGYKIYRDGSLLASVDGATFSYVDFTVIAGKFYNYEITGSNQFGEGARGGTLGFLNPNGVATGQVTSQNGNPVPGAVITLSPSLGAATAFDGTDDMMFTEYRPEFPRTTFTLSAWVKIGSGNDGAGIIDFGSHLGKNWWLHTTPAANGKGVRFGMGTTSLDHIFPAGNADEWHHVAATYNGSSLLLYGDGELIGTTPATVVPDSLPLFFGKKSNSDSNGYFHGKLDEVRLFERQLSQTELQMFMSRTVPADAEGLTAYWKFDEGIGAKTFDQSDTRSTVYFCGAEWTDDRPEIVNAGVTDASGFYQISGINYGNGTTLTATPSKVFHFNQSLEFNAANQAYAELTDFALTDSATVTVTVQAFDFTGKQSLVSKADASGGNILNLCLNAGNIDLTVGSETHSFGALGEGFHHLAVVTENGNVELYRDGVSLGSHTFSGLPANWAGLPWKLGTQANGSSGHQDYFTGLIDEAAFFNGLLPPNTITTFANTGTDVSHPALSSYFNLNEGSGTELHDMGTALTGNGATQNTQWSTVAAIEETQPHEFNPASRLVTLNTSNTSVDGVDFIDLTTVPISGFVRFMGTNCFAEGAEILVNGQSFFPQIFTDENGYFQAEFEPGTDVRLTPILADHTFTPAFWDLENLASPVAGILFRDMTKREVHGQLAGGTCRNGIIPAGGNAQVKLATLDGCFEETLTLPPGDGSFVFSDVPPDLVTLSVVHHSVSAINDYFQLQGGTTLDLTEQNDTLDFLYFAPPQIEVSALDTNACGDAMLEQLEKYTLDVRVYQDYLGARCYVDSADLNITDGISDKPQFDTVMTEGLFQYVIQPGFPNIVSPFQKTLQITAEVDAQQSSSTRSAVVLGELPRENAFVTTSPEIPLFILRDPPGDGSYAYVESGTTLCTELSLEEGDAEGAGSANRVSIGPDFEVESGFIFSFAQDIEVVAEEESSFLWTKNQVEIEATEVCLTTTETISTSDGDQVVGGQGGDVFMGAAFNMIYGVTDRVKWDTNACAFVLDVQPIVTPDSFATTYIYSEYFIENELIPSLDVLEDSLSIRNWERILAHNDELKEDAVFRRNLSFDAGIIYEFSETSDSTKTETYTTEHTFDADLLVQLGFFFGDLGAQVGPYMTWNTTVIDDSTVVNVASTTTGFVLQDDDIGDNFSVDILMDRRFRTPVFKTKSGQSSCPHEPDTQPREGVEITADSTVAINVLANEAAVFTLTLGNTSQSDDVRTYVLEAFQENNPDGAIIRFNGQVSLAAELEPNDDGTEITMTVERGPTEFDYQDLVVAFFSECEDERAEALGIDPPEAFFKTLEFDVSFIEPCSPVDISAPEEGWVITPNSPNGDILNITIDQYDNSDPDLELIRVQYRPVPGTGDWMNIEEILKADLGLVFEVVDWNTDVLGDGQYEVRAITQCTGGLNAGVSHVISGRIEREAPVVFGSPEPADGIFSAGDEISITFNEAINCDQIIAADQFSNNNIGLYEAETDDLIDATVTCSGSKILVSPNVANQFIENKTLRAEVDDIEDLVGNVAAHYEWEFLVDKNPLRWENPILEVVKYEDETLTVVREIVNTGSNIQAFTLTGIPAWADVFPTTGSLGPGEQQLITFAFDESLVVGDFLDTTFMEGSLGDEPLVIDLRVICRPPEWEVNPNNFTQTMNFSLQLDIEGEISDDNQDIVGAFIDGQLRGLAYVEYASALDMHEAFLTVYRNETDGSTVDFQIWDASECLLYGNITETYPFDADGLAGTPNAPDTIHTNNLLLRSIPLESGWNWISFNLAFPDPALDSALSSLDHPQNDFIKNQVNFAEYISSLGTWSGGLLAQLYNTGMFQYRADTPDTIDMVGAPIDASTTSIPLVAGWNWIGYLPQNPQPVGTALGSLSPQDGDIVKSQTAFAQYVPGFGWLGNLDFMEAPQGYLLKLTNPDVLQFPPGLMGGGNIDRSGDLANASPWEIVPAEFEHTMILVGMMAENGMNITEDGHILGVFHDDEVRGAAPATYIEALDERLFYLTIYSNVPGEQLQFKLYDTVSEEVSDLSESFIFNINEQVGASLSPTPFSSQTVSTVKADFAEQNHLFVRPNPYVAQTTAYFHAPSAGFAKIKVSDALGKTVAQYEIPITTGRNSFVWEGGASPGGVYFLAVEMENKTLTEKIVKKK